MGKLLNITESLPLLPFSYYLCNTLMNQRFKNLTSFRINIDAQHKKFVMSKSIRNVFICCISLFLFTQNSFSQWTQTAGPKGMNVNAFYQSGSFLYCGTSAQGVFKSTDHGVTWTAANNGIEQLSIFSLTSDASYLFAGTNEGTFRSSDDGATWLPANTGMEGQFVWSFFQNGGYLFAGTISFGLFKSNDHGTSWTDANGGALGSSSIYAMTFSSPNLIVLADNNIFYSNNNGDSWFYPVSSPFTFTTTPSFIVNGDSVLLNGGFDVFRSFNAGLSWGPPIVVEEELNMTGMVKVGNRIIAGSSKGIYSTKNFGSTWQHVNPTGLRYDNTFNHHFFKSGNNYLLAFDELGVAYSSDKGMTWQYTLAGFPPASNIDNALVVSGKILLSGTHGDGVYKSSNSGNSWTKIGTTNPLDTLSNGIIFAVYRSGSIILAGTCGDGLYRSADNGLTWTHITAGLPVDELNSLCIFGLSKSGSNFIAATDQGVYYSSNNGVSWNNTNISGTGYVAMGVAANGTTACAGVNRFTGNNEVYRSTNSGVTWTVVFASGFDDFTCVAADGVDHFYVGSFESNYVSANNGSTWNPFGPGFSPGTGAFSIAVKDNYVFAGNNTGIYFSDDHAMSFTAENEGFDPDPNMSVQGIAISNDYVFAGLFQNAVWRRPLSDFGIVLKEEVADFTNPVMNISPVPASTEIYFDMQLPAVGEGSLYIYDNTGRLIAETKFNAVENINTVLKLSVSDWMDGTYFAKVILGDFSQSRHFVVLK